MFRPFHRFTLVLPALVLVWLTADARFATAQTVLEPPVVPPDPVSVPDEPDPTPAEDPAAPAAAASSARLDEVEQTARVAARKIEILEEETATRAKEAPGVSVDDKGFAFKLADNSYQLKVRGLLQADGRFFLDDDALQSNDSFLIRKLRPSLDGTLFGLVDFRLLPELSGTPQLLDAYVDIHPFDWLHLRVGKFKGPIGLERLQSDADLPLLERALDQNLSSQREIGVQLWGDVAGGIFQYSVGVFNGSVDGAGTDTDANHAKDIAARLFVQPLRNLPEAGSLGLGIAASTGNRKGRLPNNTQLPAFRTGGQNQFFAYSAPGTDSTGALTTFPFKKESHLNPQIFYYYENIGFLAEYVRLTQSVQRGDLTADLMHQAAHATLSYVFNGRVGYDGVTPAAPFNRKTGGLGAVEIVARVAWIEIDPATYGDAKQASSQFANPASNAHAATSWAAGITWVPRRSFHLALNYERTTFDAGAGTAMAPTDRATEKVVIGRAQVNF